MIKQFKFFKIIQLQNFDLLWKTMVAQIKNYGTMEKIWKKKLLCYTMLWNFDLLWKNNGTIKKTTVLQ